MMMRRRPRQRLTKTVYRTSLVQQLREVEKEADGNKDKKGCEGKGSLNLPPYFLDASFSAIFAICFRSHFLVFCAPFSTLYLSGAVSGVVVP
jgi:hypothetical protein